MWLFLSLPALAQDPSSDGDHDGVTDVHDRCPGQQGPAGEDPTIADGCPKAAWIGPRELGVSGRIDFEAGTADLTPESMRLLDAVGELLLGQPGLRVTEVQAHTDNVGETDANLRLSQQRAEAVVAYLTARRVEPGRLVAKGYGESLPLFSNRTPEGRDQNRRVQLVIVERAAVPAGPPGLLDVRLASGSWATVEVDGRWLPRAAPLTGWELPAGSHSLVVANPRISVRHAVNIVVQPGETTTVVVPDAPMPAPAPTTVEAPADPGGIDLGDE